MDAKARILTVIGVLLLTGCGMTPREQVLFGGMVGAQFADYYTTTRYLEIGGTEANPILGERPSDGNVALFKVGVTGILYGLGELWPEHREAFYWLGIISGSGAAGWNHYQYERYK